VPNSYPPLPRFIELKHALTVRQIPVRHFPVLHFQATHYVSLTAKTERDASPEKMSVTVGRTATMEVMKKTVVSV